MVSCSAVNNQAGHLTIVFICDALERVEIRLDNARDVRLVVPVRGVKVELNSNLDAAVKWALPQHAHLLGGGLAERLLCRCKAASILTKQVVAVQDELYACQVLLVEFRVHANHAMNLIERRHLLHSAACSPDNDDER
jgi:hypothetical protein